MTADFVESEGDQGGPADERSQRRDAWHRERRRVARQHHPDTGGDPEVFVSQLAEVDRRYGFAPSGGRTRTVVTVMSGQLLPVRLARARRRLGRRSKNYTRRLRSRIPRRVPGSRRYFDV